MNEKHYMWLLISAVSLVLLIIAPPVLMWWVVGIWVGVIYEQVRRACS